MWGKKKIPIRKTIEGFLYIEVLFNGMPICFILDSGSTSNIISELFADEFKLKQTLSNMQLKGLGDTIVNPKQTSFTIYAGKIPYIGIYLVQHESSFEYPVAGILGLPFLDSMVESMELTKEVLILR